MLPSLVITRLVLVLALLGACAYGSDIVEGIAATVNDHMILQSDCEDEIRYEGFVNGSSISQITADERKAALERLIDQELLREQMRAADLIEPDSAQINARIADIRKQHKGAGDDAEWKRLLAANGLNEDEITQRITLQLQVARLVDHRLRPEADVSTKSIESYYNQKLLPELRRRGSADVPLAAVQPKIKELLTQEAINQLLIAWLQDLRATSRIHTEAVSAK